MLSTYKTLNSATATEANGSSLRDTSLPPSNTSEPLRTPLSPVRANTKARSTSHMDGEEQRSGGFSSVRRQRAQSSRLTFQMLDIASEEEQDDEDVNEPQPKKRRDRSPGAVEPYLIPDSDHESLDGFSTTVKKVPSSSRPRKSESVSFHVTEIWSLDTYDIHSSQTTTRAGHCFHITTIAWSEK